MSSNDIVIILCNLIPAIIALYYPFNGWSKGGVYMLISFAKLISIFFITRYLSGLLTNLILSNTAVNQRVAAFILSNQDKFSQIPGAAILFSGMAIGNTIEDITHWFVYFLCFILIFLILNTAFSVFLRLAIKFNKIPVFGYLNRLLGLITGAVLGLFITLLLVYLVSFILNILGYPQIEAVLISSWLPVLFRTLF